MVAPEPIRTFSSAIEYVDQNIAGIFIEVCRDTYTAFTQSALTQAIRLERLKNPSGQRPSSRSPCALLQSLHGWS